MFNQPKKDRYLTKLFRLKLYRLKILAENIFEIPINILYFTLKCFQKLAELLYKSASEHGYINPEKVEEILCVPKPDESIKTKCSNSDLIGK